MGGAEKAPYRGPRPDVTLLTRPSWLVRYVGDKIVSFCLAALRLCSLKKLACRIQLHNSLQGIEHDILRVEIEVLRKSGGGCFCYS